MDSGKVFLGVLAGIAAGAVLGILFAPDKGSETRKKLAGKGEDYSDLVKEKVNEFLGSMSEKFEKVKEEVSEFAEHAHVKAEDMKKEAKTARG
jgi:gas vesicle protein